MSSFNECMETLKDLAVEGAQTAIKKTKQLAGIAKANLAIRSEEEKIKKAHIELGKLYYKDYIVGEEPDAAEYAPWCEKISESKIAIEDLKITIDELRNAKIKEDEDEDGDDEDDDDIAIEIEVPADDEEEDDDGEGETPAE